MIDGIILTDALGIDAEGKKQIVGKVKRHVAKALLLLDGDRARLFVIDGAKALSSAIREVFGALAAIQRCQSAFWGTCRTACTRT